MQNPLSLESLISWLEKQPTDGRYFYLHCHNCLIAQYLQAMGFRVYSVGSDSWSELIATDKPLKNHQLPEGWGRLANKMPHTYGEAYLRALELKANG